MADAGGYLSAQENYAAKVNTSIGTRGTGLACETFCIQEFHVHKDIG